MAALLICLNRKLVPVWVYDSTKLPQSWRCAKKSNETSKQCRNVKTRQIYRPIYQWMPSENKSMEIDCMTWKESKIKPIIK